MTAVATGSTIVAVIMALFGTVAFLRLPSPLDRLHAGSFVSVAAGVPMVLAGFASEGVTGRTLKLAAVVVVLILSGALANHAIARALLYRGGQRR